MTHTYSKRKKGRKPSAPKSLVTIFFLFIVLLLSTTLSDTVSKYTKQGLEICFYSVIGSVFPFMILTDLFIPFTDFYSFKRLRHLFERLFSVNGRGISAFIAGIVCGFPMGIKVAKDLYSDGIISRDECERLIGFSTAPSPAFIISAVGLGMRKSAKEGLIIYLCTVLSLITAGVIFGIGCKASASKRTVSTPRFNLTVSINQAASNTVFICGIITLFSVLIGLMREFLDDRVLYFLVPCLEISTAASFLAKMSNQALSIALTGFSAAFSGISVLLQGKHLLSGTDVSCVTYIKMKLFAGGLCAAVSSAALSILK